MKDKKEESVVINQEQLEVINLTIPMPIKLYELIEKAATAHFEDIPSWCRRNLLPAARKGGRS